MKVAAPPQPQTLQVMTIANGLLMAFGLGLLIASVGVMGNYAIAIGAVLLTAGSIYGTLFGVYCWWRSAD